MMHMSQPLFCFIWIVHSWTCATWTALRVSLLLLLLFCTVGTISWFALVHFGTYNNIQPFHVLSIIRSAILIKNEIPIEPCVFFFFWYNI